MAAAGTQYSHLSTFASFGALLCKRTARTLLNPLPTEQGLLAERLPQPDNAGCAYHPSPAFVSAELNFFVELKPFRPIRAIQDMGCRVGGGGGDSGPGRNGRH